MLQLRRNDDEVRSKKQMNAYKNDKISDRKRKKKYFGVFFNSFYCEIYKRRKKRIK